MIYTTYNIYKQTERCEKRKNMEEGEYVFLGEMQLPVVDDAHGVPRGVRHGSASGKHLRENNDHHLTVKKRENLYTSRIHIE